MHARLMQKQGRRLLSVLVSFVLACGICIPTTALSAQPAYADQTTIKVNQEAATTLEANSKYIITAEQGGSTYALSSTDNESQGLKGVPVTISGSELTITGEEAADTIEWTFTGSTGDGEIAQFYTGESVSGVYLKIAQQTLSASTSSDDSANLSANYGTGWTIQKDVDGTKYAVALSEGNFNVQNNSSGDQGNKLKIYKVVPASTVTSVSMTASVEPQTYNGTTNSTVTLTLSGTGNPKWPSSMDGLTASWTLTPADESYSGTKNGTWQLSADRGGNAGLSHQVGSQLVPGTYNVTVNFTGQQLGEAETDTYTGEVTAQFTVNRVDLTSQQITLESESATYTGQPITPTVKINDWTVNSGWYTLQFTGGPQAAPAQGTSSVTNASSEGYDWTLTPTDEGKPYLNGTASNSSGGNSKFTVTAATAPTYSTKPSGSVTVAAGQTETITVSITGIKNQTDLNGFTFKAALSGNNTDKFEITTGAETLGSTLTWTDGTITFPVKVTAKAGVTGGDSAQLDITATSTGVASSNYVSAGTISQVTITGVEATVSNVELVASVEPTTYDASKNSTVTLTLSGDGVTQWPSDSVKVNWSTGGKSGTWTIETSSADGTTLTHDVGSALEAGTYTLTIDFEKAQLGSSAENTYSGSVTASFTVSAPPSTGGGTPEPPASEGPSVNGNDTGNGSTDVAGGDVTYDSTSTGETNDEGQPTYNVSATLTPEKGQKAYSATVTVNGKEVSYSIDKDGNIVVEGVTADDVVIITPIFQPTEATPGTFEDVTASDWYDLDVYEVYNLGYMMGYGNPVSGALPTSFGPADNLTRGQAAVIFFNMTGGTYNVNGRFNALLYEEDNPFSDVSNALSDVYRNAVVWADEQGLVQGYAGTGTYGPDDEVTREQVALILFRYASLPGVSLPSTQLSDAEVETILSQFPDGDTIASWARTAVAWAAKNHYMGRAGYLWGGNNITRAEMAAMTTRVQPDPTDLGLVPTL